MRASSPPKPGHERHHAQSDKVPDKAPIVAFFAGRHIHYGWVVVAATFLISLVTAGAIGAPGVMIIPLEKEFGWSNAEISSSSALRLMLFGLIGPFAAAFMNRFGLRIVGTIALLVTAAGIIGSFFMTEVWQLIALWGLLVGVGAGVTGSVFGATVATRWFTEKRGLVVGLLTASTATGQLVFLPVLAKLTDLYGWRMALVFLLTLLALALVTGLILVRDRPSDLGMTPYGDRGDVIAPPPRDGFGKMLLSPLVALRDASRTRVFWLLFGTFFICGASTNGLVQTHFVALCGDFGITPVTAAGLLAIIGIFDFIGTVASGWLSDRYSPRMLLFWYYGLRGLSLVYLPFTNFGFYELSLFAIFYGLDWVATVPPTVKLTADHFGERTNLVYGWIVVGHQIGAAGAAYGAGYVRTEYSTYLPAFSIAGLLCVVAALTVIGLKETRKPKPVPA